MVQKMNDNVTNECALANRTVVIKKSRCYKYIVCLIKLIKSISSV